MILLAGPPGAGKSVQAKKLESAGNVKWLSVGSILRDNLSEDFKEMMMRGELVPDEVVQDTLVEAVAKIPVSTRIVLDGFPRRQSQIDWFQDYLASSERNLEGVIHLYIPEDIAVARLEARGRMDDDVQTIHQRYLQYKNEIVPMLDELSASGTTVHVVNGTDAIELVHENIVSEIKHLI